MVKMTYSKKTLIEQIKIRLCLLQDKTDTDNLINIIYSFIDELEKEYNSTYYITLRKKTEKRK